MSIDLSSVFGGASSTQDPGMQDALQAGGNSALGYIEGQAMSAIKANQSTGLVGEGENAVVNWLSSDQKSNNTAAQTAISKILSNPSNPNGFAAYFSNLVQNPALKQYGPYILGAVAVIGLVAYTAGRA